MISGDIMLIECISYFAKNIIGTVFVLFILNKLIGYKVQVKKVATVISTIALVTMSTIPFFALDNAELAFTLADLSTLLLFAVFPYSVLKPTKKKIFFLFGLILNLLLDLSVAVITTTINITSEVTTNWIYAGILAVLLIVVIAIYYKRNFVVPVDFFESIPSLFYFVILVACVATQYTLTLSQDATSYADVAQLLLIVSAGFILVCLSYMVFKYITVSLKEKDSLEQLDMQIKHYEELAQKSQDIRRFRHDYKNHLFMLGVMLDENKLDDAKKHLARLTEEIKETETKFATGNYFADALIAHKAYEALKSNIQITFHGSIHPDKIDNSDLCTILANSLDNAIRASISLSPCTIHIEASTNEKGCTITVTNPVSNKIEIKNNTIKTSKKDTDNHGFGINNIKHTVQKYDGFVTLSSTDKIFSIKIGLLF